MLGKYTMIAIAFIITVIIISSSAFLVLSYTKVDTAKVKNTLFISPAKYQIKNDGLYCVRHYEDAIYKTDLEGRKIWEYATPWDERIEDFTIADYVYVASEKALYILNNSGVLVKKVAFSSLVNSTNDSLYWPIILWSYKNSSYLHLNQHVYFLNGTDISNMGNLTITGEPLQRIMFGEDTIIPFKFRNYTELLDFHKYKILWSLNVSGHFFVKYPYIVEYDENEIKAYKNNSMILKMQENNHKILGTYISENKIIVGLVEYPYTRKNIHDLILNVYDLHGDKIANGTINISPELTRDHRWLSFCYQNNALWIIEGHYLYITTIPEKINENLHWEKYSLEYSGETFIKCDKNVLITHTSTDDNYAQIITFYTLYSGYDYVLPYNMEYKDFLILGTIIAIPVGLGMISKLSKNERLKNLEK